MTQVGGVASDIEQTVTQALAERRRKCAESYRELLLRSATPQPGDEQALLDAMAVLGRAPSDVPMDLELFTSTIQCEELAAQEERLHAEHVARHKELGDTLAWAQQARADLQREIETRTAAVEKPRNRSQAAYNEAQRARTELSTLRDKWEALVRDVSLERIRDEARARRFAENPSVFSRPRSVGL